MFQHPRLVRVHIAQREAEPIPQLISKITSERATATTVNRNTRPTSANNDDDDDQSTTRGRAPTSSTGGLLGAPVSASARPTSSAVSSNDDDNNNDNDTQSSSSSSDDDTDSQPTTTANRNHVSSQSSKSAVVTSTMVTSTLSTSHSTSNSKSVSNTSSAAGNTATKGASTGSDSTSEGMSTGGKIGLAIGIIAIIGAFALLAMFLMAKNRKKQREALAREEDEKRAADNAAAAAAAKQTRVSAPSAPRLSLRPVSRLVPELMGGSRQKDNTNQGNMLTTFSQSSHGPADRSLSPSGNMQSSQSRDNPFTDPVNPFTDPEKAAASGAMRSPPSLGPPAAIGATYRQPHDQAHELEDTRSMSQASRPGTANGSFVPLDASPPAPAPAVATGPGPDQPQGTVYRVMMDFKPTMEDELELRQGSHVRLLHEYDDGWALCIRLDRTHQGVVPRTCLAAKPSKPRPGPGPGPNGNRQGPGPNGHMNPASRSTTPNGMSPRLNVSPGPGSAGFRPGSPGNARQMGPGNGPRHQGPPYPTSGPGAFNQAPRPLSPGPRQQKRSESPGPYGAGGPPPMGVMSQRPRSNSESQPNANQRQNSPPGPSRLGSGPTSGPGFAM